MSPASIHVLAVNAGSSSARFAVYDLGAKESLLLSAGCEGIGLAIGRCYVRDGAGRALYDGAGSIADHESAARKVVEWLRKNMADLGIDAAGPGIAHGGRRFAEPVLLTAQLQDELFHLTQLDPGHPEPDLRLVRAMAELLPGLPSIACFDTAFHRTMATVAPMHPLPRELFD